MEVNQYVIYMYVCQVMFNSCIELNKLKLVEKLDNRIIKTYKGPSPGPGKPKTAGDQSSLDPPCDAPLWTKDDKWLIHLLHRYQTYQLIHALMGHHHVLKTCQQVMPSIE